MNKIVITGATGMIGLAVLNECLLHGSKVLAIVRPNSPNVMRIPKSPQVTVLDCDIDNYQNCVVDEFGKDWDVFYHFAWNSIDSSDRDNVELQNQNVGYTISAIELAKRLGCRMFIGAGSQAEYGTYRTGRIGEDTPTNPVDAYGIAKQAAGQYAAIKARQLDMISVWVRIFSVYGPFDRSTSLIQTTISKLRNNEVPKFTKATQMWDYLYSADAGRALYLIGLRCNKSGVYCLGYGKSRPLLEFIKIIHRKVNPSIELGIGQLPYTGYPISIEPDIEPLAKDVGFTPVTSFEEGIAQILTESTVTK